jgi:hypothetical protein
MSSLANNTTNRISSSSITTNNTTYSQPLSSFTNNTNNSTNDCDASSSSSSSTTTTMLGLTAMGLAATSLATMPNNNNTINSNNTECDSKRHITSSSIPFKLHSNTTDDPYASFYALNRTLPQPPPVPTGTSPFNLISQSPNNNLQFVSNPTG